MTTKNTPVMTTVMVSVLSICFQFDASAVVHHGLTSWNSTDPTTMTTSAMAMPLRASCPDGLVRPATFQSGVGQRHGQAEHQVADERGPAAQFLEPGKERCHA